MGPDLEAGAPGALPNARTGFRYVARKVALALIICALAAGSLAFASLRKQVTLLVDGHSTTVSTYAVNVGDVMAEAKISASSKDIVVPAKAQRAADGSTVTIVHARPITLSVDGQATTRWVAALTVSEALSQLGYDPDEVYTRASRSARLPIQGAKLSILTPKKFTVVADGKTFAVESAGPTVKAALIDAGVALGKSDTLSVPANTTLEVGMTVAITRVKVTVISESRTVPFEVVKQADPEVYVGIDSVLIAGVTGTAVVDVEVTTVEGKPPTRRDLSAVLAEAPVNEVVKTGAKQFPAEVDALNWYALATCESTNNPRAVSASGTYSGAYQFSVATWASVGGSGVPKDATPEEQLARAKMLYIRSGAGQWECGSHLQD